MKKQIKEFVSKDAKRERAIAIADVLELEGMLDLADNVRRNPQIEFVLQPPSDAFLRRNGTPEKILEQHPHLDAGGLRKTYEAAARLWSLHIGDEGWFARLEPDVAIQVKSILESRS